MNYGEKVIYAGKEYVLLHFYSSGYCEIKSVESSNIELVHMSEIQLLIRKKEEPTLKI